MSSGRASIAARALVADPMEDVGQESSAFCAARRSPSLSG
jgi:hypothetical protein